MFQRREVEDSQTPPPPQPQGSGNGGGSYATRIVRPLGPQAALTISAVYRAVELRAKTEAQFQIQYQRLNREGGNFIADLGAVGSKYVSYGQRLNYLLQVQPNPTMSATQMIEQVVIDRLMLGNGFIYIERDPESNEPLYLWRARCGGYDTVSGLYTLTYMSDHGEVARIQVPREDVLHFPNTYRLDDGLWGIPTLRYALDTLSLNKTLSAQALDSAAKGGRVKLIIGEEKPAQGAGTLAFGLMNKGAMEEYAKEVNTKIYQQDVVALRGLDKVQQISMSAQEMQQTEMLGMTVDDVARFYGTQRPLLMADTNSHYTTYQNARMEFMQWTVQPDVVEMEQEFNRKLLNIYDFSVRRIHFCEQPLLRLDKEAQAKVDQLRLQTGTTTVNELRKQYDMPSVENGDEPMASANLMTLKALIAKSEGATELKPGNYNVPEPQPKDGEGNGDE